MFSKLNQTQFKNTYSKSPNFNFTLRMSYYNSSSPNNPIPVLTITDLQDKDSMFSKRDLVLRKGCIYRFLIKVYVKQ